MICITELVLDNLYKIRVPLPRNPLKELNSYVIMSGDRALVIDTGMNRPECRKVLQQGLQELGVDLKKTDFFVTHMHSDHCGLVSYFSTGTSRVYCSRPDAGIINSSGNPGEMLEFARLNGFPESELESAGASHPGYKYRPEEYINFSIIKDGDRIEAGDYLFECVETPGHTPGHMCLYEPRRKLLVAGDHLLRDITPNISLWLKEGDPLQDYLQSLEKIKELDIEMVLPGHRRCFEDWELRIEELQEHHKARTGEILSVLEQGAGDAYRVASQMSWDMNYSSWEEFPVVQKWFATGEALAHLRYLENNGAVTSEFKEGKYLYYKV